VNEILTLATLTAALRLMVPVAVAALGEVITERSGVLNLGVEGTMLTGAYAGYTAARATGSPWAGLAAGAAAGIACGIVLALLMVVARTNQIVTGLAFTLGAAALTTYLFERSYDLGSAPPRVAGLNLPELLAVTAAVALAVWFLLERTSAGLVLTAVGEDPGAADALGTRVAAVRCAATVGGNALVGLAGALLVCGPLGIFVQNVTAGRGWIALALVVFARWRPVPLVLGALLFGACEAVRLRLQNTTTDIPYEVFLALPYLVTLIVLVAASRRAHSPAALAVPFDRTHH
jgi:general nucleoside transport system permease protein